MEPSEFARRPRTKTRRCPQGMAEAESLDTLPFFVSQLGRDFCKCPYHRFVSSLQKFKRRSDIFARRSTSETQAQTDCPLRWRDDGGNGFANEPGVWLTLRTRQNTTKHGRKIVDCCATKLHEPQPCFRGPFVPRNDIDVADLALIDGQ